LQHTRTIPIVFALVSDPIGSGFVASLARPGGNATGFVVTEGSQGGKWLELLKEIAPRVTRVAAMFNPAAAPYVEIYMSPFKTAAQSFGVEGSASPVQDTSEMQSVLNALGREPNGALIVMPDSFTLAHRVEITSLATRYRLPAVYPHGFFAEVSGLLSYGNDLNENFRHAATYADRILKGAKPNELPVQAPVKFELVINLKTARALRLDVPHKLLALARALVPSQKGELVREKDGRGLPRLIRQSSSPNAAAGAAPQDRANRQRTVVLASTQRPQLGIYDGVATSPSTRAETSGVTNPGRCLRRGHGKKG